MDTVCVYANGRDGAAKDGEYEASPDLICRQVKDSVGAGNCGDEKVLDVWVRCSCTRCCVMLRDEMLRET